MIDRKPDNNRLPDLLVESVKKGYETSRPKYWKTLKEVSRDMRVNPTEAEKLLWEKLRGKQLGCRFRRQHVIDKYIVDFVCLSENLIIEVDGNVHEKQNIYDQQRTEVLDSLGFSVVRFSNEQIENDVANVIKMIKKMICV